MTELELKFIQVSKNNPQHCEAFRNLMLPYQQELDAPLSNDLILNYAQSCIDMQGPYDRHLELAYSNDELAGFIYGKVDRKGQRGFIKPGYGYIMEFYVKPEHRRKGYGEKMFLRLERLFAEHGVRRIWLNTGAGGELFWRAMGFVPTGERSPDNKMPIYEKQIYRTSADKLQRIFRR